MSDVTRCERCDRPVATPADWRRAESSDEPEAPWAVALCWAEGANCEPIDWRARALAAEADLRRVLDMLAARDD